MREKLLEKKGVGTGIYTRLYGKSGIISKYKPHNTKQEKGIMSGNIQWEYHIELVGSAFRSPKPDVIEAYLNQVGEGGWEVINLHHPHNSNKVWITMKRPLSMDVRRRRSWPDEGW